MKQAIWEQSPGSLVAWLLANTQARPIDVWTITLLNGTVLRYTSGDAPITINGITWLLGPGMQRTRVRQSIGVSVDTCTLTVHANDTVLVNGTPILQAMTRGAFNGATVLLGRAFLDDAGTCQGLAPGFYGRFGGVKAGRSSATVEVRSHAELLDVQIPTEVYQPACRNTVFDAQCGLAAAAWTVAGTTNAAGDATRRVITSNSAAVVAVATGWADLGQLTMTSGLNAGVSRTVRMHTLNSGLATITAQTGFPYPIDAAASFSLRAGCNKVKDGDCTAKFGNVPRFRGEPYVPEPETVT